jgi:hypothetical protein
VVVQWCMVIPRRSRNVSYVVNLRIAYVMILVSVKISKYHNSSKNQSRDLTEPTISSAVCVNAWVSVVSLLKGLIFSSSNLHSSSLHLP